MRLTCHLICCGKFYPAGVPIPPDVVLPGGAMQYIAHEIPSKTARVGGMPNPRPPNPLSTTDDKREPACHTRALPSPLG
jgi:hypothetical protein